MMRCENRKDKGFVGLLRLRGQAVPGSFQYALLGPQVCGNAQAKPWYDVG